MNIRDVVHALTAKADERVERLRGITDGADDALQRWADEDNGGE